MRWWQPSWFPLGLGIAVGNCIISAYYGWSADQFVRTTIITYIIVFPIRALYRWYRERKTRAVLADAEAESQRRLHQNDDLNELLLQATAMVQNTPVAVQAPKKRKTKAAPKKEAKPRKRNPKEKATKISLIFTDDE